MIAQFSIPASQPVGRIGDYYDYGSPLPADRVLGAAEYGFRTALTDMRGLIERARTKDEAVEIMKALAALTSSAIALERKALAAMEAFDGPQGVA